MSAARKVAVAWYQWSLSMPTPQLCPLKAHKLLKVSTPFLALITLCFAKLLYSICSKFKKAELRFLLKFCVWQFAGSPVLTNILLVQIDFQGSIWLIFPFKKKDIFINSCLKLAECIFDSGSKYSRNLVSWTLKGFCLFSLSYTCSLINCLLFALF